MRKRPRARSPKSAPMLLGYPISGLPKKVYVPAQRTCYISRKGNIEGEEPITKETQLFHKTGNGHRFSCIHRPLQPNLDPQAKETANKGKLVVEKEGPRRIEDAW